MGDIGQWLVVLFRIKIFGLELFFRLHPKLHRLIPDICVLQTRLNKTLCPSAKCGKHILFGIEFRENSLDIRFGLLWVTEVCHLSSVTLPALGQLYAKVQLWHPPGVALCDCSALACQRSDQV